MKKCKNCGSRLFHINHAACEDCKYNGSYTEHDGYIYEELPKGAERDQSYTEGECKLGDSFDEGCYQFVCASCGAITHLALVVQ